MIDDTLIYEEIWPWGRMMHLRLTSHCFATSVFKSFSDFVPETSGCIDWDAVSHQRVRPTRPGS
jgi:hypothetical protein